MRDDPQWSTAVIADRMPPKPSGLRALTHINNARNEDIARLGELAPDAPLQAMRWHASKPGNKLEYGQ